MKLRLVREDGSAATIGDLLLESHGPSLLEIGGIDTLLMQVDGPDLSQSARRDGMGAIHVTLTYRNIPQAAFGWESGRGRSTDYSCPFFWRHWSRQTEGLGLESRRRLERTESFDATAEPSWLSRWAAPSNGMARVTFMGAGLEHHRVDVPICVGDTASGVIDGIAAGVRAHVGRSR